MKKRNNRKPRSPFRAALAESARDRGKRRWIFVPYDQLSDEIGPLAREDPRELGVIMVECPGKAARRPYHRQKLALVLANMRHFALEQAARGVAVLHVVAPHSYAEALAPLARELGPIRVMRPAERELCADLARLAVAGQLELLPHEGWLTTREQFTALAGDPPWRLDRFYRAARRATGTLVARGRPAGGKWSFDTENRLPWKGDPPAPTAPRFQSDPIKDEVADLIAARYGDHPGQLDLEALPATRDDAEHLWRWAQTECLPHFGPFEDAMSARSRGLFHTRISSLLNLHRLLPARVVRDAARLDIPLASKEGFIRQVLGWREFMRHVHEATDGFRRLPGAGLRVRTAEHEDGGAEPSFLGAAGPLPPAYWGRIRSGLACLDTVVSDVWREGYSHHITRLMVLANIATLLDVSPRALTDWFWVAFTDAYDWVVEPNVLGMGTYAAGDLMTTKPYVSGAAYIDRMSDLCPPCAFDPRANCPLTPLYWAFLARHEPELDANPRMRLPLAALRKRSAAARKRDQSAFRRASAELARGRPLSPGRDG